MSGHLSELSDAEFITACEEPICQWHPACDEDHSELLATFLKALERLKRANDLVKLTQPYGVIIDAGPEQAEKWRETTRVSNYRCSTCGMNMALCCECTNPDRKAAP